MSTEEDGPDELRVLQAKVNELQNCDESKRLQLIAEIRDMMKRLDLMNDEEFESLD